MQISFLTVLKFTSFSRTLASDLNSELPSYCVKLKAIQGQEFDFSQLLQLVKSTALLDFRALYCQFIPISQSFLF